MRNSPLNNGDVGVGAGGGARAQYPHEPKRPVDVSCELRTCLSTGPSSRADPAASPHQARPHPARARQFMPFAARTGYHELVRQQERVQEDAVEAASRGDDEEGLPCRTGCGGRDGSAEPRDGRDSLY